MYSLSCWTIISLAQAVVLRHTHHGPADEDTDHKGKVEQFRCKWTAEFGFCLASKFELDRTGSQGSICDELHHRRVGCHLGIDTGGNSRGFHVGQRYVGRCDTPFFRCTLLELNASVILGGAFGIENNADAKPNAIASCRWDLGVDIRGVHARSTSPNFRPDLANGTYDKALVATMLEHATVHVNATTTIEDGTVVLHHGKIVSGPSSTVQVQGPAVRLDMTGLHLYPSFVDLHSDFGTPEVQSAGWSRTPQDVSDKKGAYGWNEAVRPETSAWHLNLKRNKPVHGARRDLGRC